MTRNIYLSAFIAMAATFIPVFLYFGLSDYTVPVICIAYGFTLTLFQAQWLLSLWTLGHIVLYLALFYACGRLVFWLSSFPDAQFSRTAVQLFALLVIFACSFLRVVTYTSIAGVGGTYTFWGAVSRFAHNKLQ